MILIKEIKSLPGSRVEAVIVVEKSIIKKKYDEILEKYCLKFKVPGFRKGKVPISILKAKYSENLNYDTMKDIIYHSSREFFNEAERKPLSYTNPKIVNENLYLDFDVDFVYKIVYEAYPEFEIPNLDDIYNNISINMDEVIFGDDDVEKELKILQEQNSVIIEDDMYFVEEGNIVTADFVELDENENEIKCSMRQDFVFTVGESNSYYDFGKDIIKMKRNEERIVEKKYDDDYRFKDLAGLSKKIKIKIKNIRKKDIPALNDEFAKNISDDFNTLEDLKKHIIDNISRFIKEKQKEIKMSKFLSEFSKKVDIDIPESMVNTEIENTITDVASQNKMDVEEFKRTFVLSRGMISDKFKNEIIFSLKSKLIFQKLVDINPLEITDFDIEDELKIQAKNNKMTYKDIDKFYKDQNLFEFLKYEIKKRKVKNSILEKIKEVHGNKISLKEFLKYNLGQNEKRVYV